MDVIFETSTGRKFTMEIWFFATVLEMKEGIQKHQGIPVSKQTLVFNGQVMADDRGTEHYQLLQGSRIRLAIDDDDGGPPADPGKPHDAARLHLLIKVPMSRRQFPLEAAAGDTVGRLKERIHEVEGSPASRLALFFGSTELQDHRTLGECDVADGSEVSVVARQFPPAPGCGGSRRMRVVVLTQCGAKVPVEVNASDNVSELRRELQRLQGQLHFHLPGEGYFFIYKQNVMDEDRNFRWHDVRHGDTIEIFNGSVSGGS